MTAWTKDELAKIAAADELEVTPARSDGTLRKPVTIWVVRHGDDLYVRSWHGRNSSWFRGVEERDEGHVRAGGVDKDVAFEEVDDVNDEVDAAYRAKYNRYVDPMVAPQARARRSGWCRGELETRLRERRRVAVVAATDVGGVRGCVAIAGRRVRRLGQSDSVYEAYRRTDGLTKADLSLTVVAYFLAAVTALLIFGRLSNHVGRRPVSLAALAFVAAGCLYCSTFTVLRR